MQTVTYTLDAGGSAWAPFGALGDDDHLVTVRAISGDLWVGATSFTPQPVSYLSTMTSNVGAFLIKSGDVRQITFEGGFGPYFASAAETGGNSIFSVVVARK